MPSPYTILGVTESDDDATIRARYLTLVRENPPERDAAKFTEIRAAYEKIKDLHTRLNFWLTQPANPTELEELIADLSTNMQRTRMSLPQMLQLVKTKK